MNIQQSLDKVTKNLKLSEKQKNELNELFYKILFLNILDQLHSLLSQEQRDKLLSSFSKDENSEEDIKKTLSSLKEFGVTKEKAQEIIVKAQEFALNKIQE